MAGLAGRVQAHQTCGRLDRGLEVAPLHLAVRQPVHGGHGQRAQPIALHGQPVLEGRLPQPETFEQVAPIEADGSFERFRAGFRGQPLEISDIHADGIGV